MGRKRLQGKRRHFIRNFAREEGLAQASIDTRDPDRDVVLTDLRIGARFRHAVRFAAQISDADLRLIKEESTRAILIDKTKRLKKECPPGYNQWAYAMTMMPDDSGYFDEYLNLVIYLRAVTEGTDSAIKAMNRWYRIRPHWLRIRRRICDHCCARTDLSKPRYLVCSACGVARYCSKKCQIKDWDHHQTCCAMLNRELVYSEITVEKHRSYSEEERERLERETIRAQERFREKYGR